jgi:polysaccharide biosynthesis protein PslH
MHILFIVPYTPNLVRVRPYNLIRSLVQRGHQVTVLTLYTSPAEYQEIEKLRQIGCQVTAFHMKKSVSLWNCLLALPGKTPLQAVYSWHPQLANAMINIVNNPQAPIDIVHIEHLRGINYGVHLKSYSKNGNRKTPIVWDSVDCISLLFRQASEKRPSRLKRWLTSFELSRTERYEGWLVSQFDPILVTSDLDRKALIALSKNDHNDQRILVVANGVDLDFFRPNPQIEADPATLIVSGKMSYHANQAMVCYLVNEIMPLIWKLRPAVKLVIAGKDPPKEIRHLAQDTRINVTGTVDDLRPYLWRASIAVAPLIYGVGIQNKILEAMACGVPVITTPQAITALGVTPGNELLVASNAQDFALEAINLLDNQQKKKDLAQAGYNYVRMKHDWALISSHLEEIYQDKLGNSKVF